MSEWQAKIDKLEERRSEVESADRGILKAKADAKTSERLVIIINRLLATNASTNHDW